ncbi:ABC-type branched-chain amino acid transport system, ATPase component [Herbaspirillum sp. CF444]|uniref:ABC transporter ATP-binding protein n=1 Tax=Herbaspirillum sp. CF444 TaxID=1144319 RepID=UPI0002728438|nr:ABC transporter ATP-binding protein [Herbaspirillum sp. CF444]EJL85303.1 ABC-type branched-chain amino acid transport system, ATPase component [Herbaspirillum sp. CF444]
MSTPILKAVNVTKRYGKFTAVNNITLDILPGTVHSVIGPNGAGKTTLFHTLTGTTPITEGSILVEGEEVSHLPGYKRVRKGLARSFQVTSLFPNLSVRENLRLAAQGTRPAQALNPWKRPELLRQACDIAEQLVTRLNLQGVADRLSSELSHGQQRRLEVGMAMAGQPKVIFLDEPTSGMGIDDIADMKKLIHSLRDNYTVVLIEHNMDIVMDISDSITVMQQGQILAQGKPNDIRNDERVRRAYLGSMITGGKKAETKAGETT